MTRSLVRLFFTLTLAVVAALNAATLAESFTVFTRAVQEEPANAIVVLALLVTIAAVFRFALRVLVHRPPSSVAVSSGMAILQRESPAKYDLDLDRRARHEAAHVVVALAIGREGVHADVVIRGASGGQTIFDPGTSTMTNATFEEMIITCAGHIIDIQDGHFDRGSYSDMRSLMENALLILSSGQQPDCYDGDLTTDALVLGAKRAAEQILEAHAESVDRISHELEQKHVVSEQQLRELFDEANDARP